MHVKNYGGKTISMNMSMGYITPKRSQKSTDAFDMISLYKGRNLYHQQQHKM